MFKLCVYLLGVGLLEGTFSPAEANPTSRIRDLTGFSGLPDSPTDIEMQKLSCARRQDVGVESLFFVPAAPDTVLQRLTNWTPTAHPQLGVFIHRSFDPPPTAAVFEKLAQPPANPSVRLLERETARSPQNFNLSEAERNMVGQILRKNPGAAGVWRFWRQLLNERSTTYYKDGVRKLPPYRTAKGEVLVVDEALALIKSQKALFAHFKELLKNAIFAPQPGTSRKAYWELFSVQGMGTLNLGALYWAPGDGGYQVIDFQYYYSGGLYTNLMFYQIWPASVGGQSGSVVWRCDLLSSPFFDSSGVNRMGTDMMMQQEVKKTITLLQGDLSK